MSSKVSTPKKRKASISEGKASGNPKKSAVSGGQDDEAPAPSGRSSSQQEKPKAKNRRVDPAPSSGPSSTTSTARQDMPNSSGSAGGDVAPPRRKLKLKLKQQQHKTKQQQQQHQQKHQKQQQKQQKQRRPTGRRPKVLLHELAAQRYAAFLAETTDHAHLPPLSHYRRPRRKRQRTDMNKAVISLRVPQAGPVEGTHMHQFAPEWRKSMTVDPEPLGAFFKPGGGVIEPTLQAPPELKLAGIQGNDLNHGYLIYVEPDTASSTSEITEMLDETPGLEREEESAHFITYRNNLNKILVAPYSKQKWEIQVFKEGGVIYLEVVSDRNRGMMDRTSYWGRRFETLCVLGVEGARLDELQRGPNDPARPSYCALFRSRLGSHNLLMGAEIDACRPKNPGRFVEIKTTRNIRDSKDEQIFKKHKTLKYWAQCYLAGVRDLVVGYRDDQGIVREIKSWTTDGLVESVDKFKHWDKDVCLNFADRCLSFLKENVDEGPRYSFKYAEPFEEITLEVLDTQPIYHPIAAVGDGASNLENM